MSDLSIRRHGRAGRITLTRAKALNALNYEMCLAIDAALRAWQNDSAADLIILDAEGDKAFCAGGDIAEIYKCGLSGEHAYAQRFWADEYRMNARIADYPKPVVSFLQGFTMGGGVGLGCHGSHRIVGESSRISMPECGIGLVPDVGGSYILARAPGRLGAYLGLTGARLGPGDAVYAGFANRFIPETSWPEVIAALCETGATSALPQHPAPAASLPAQQAQIDQVFASDDLAEVMQALPAPGEDTFWDETHKALKRAAPLSLACTLAILAEVRASPTMQAALIHEYRFTYRALAQADFVEGIRAAIIDKDRSPKWRHSSWRDVPQSEVASLTASLGDAELKLEDH